MTADAPPGTRLSPAERRALRIRAQVDTDKEAAAVAGISVYTMRWHLARARSRLGVSSTYRAIQAFAARGR